MSLTTVTVKELIEAGVHFGHRASRWHPKMQPYIFGKHNQIHIVDLRETMRGMIKGGHFLAKLTEAGHEVIFVGTKPQARDVVRETAVRCGMHFVVNRWLGGTLTNFNTIRSRLRRLEELEALETTGGMSLRRKKEVSRLRREHRKIFRNLEGVRKLGKQPGAIVVVDVRRDHIAVAEARMLNIPVVAICDTDVDPSEVDIPIPGNDDAYRSIEVILRCLGDSVTSGRDKLMQRQAAEEKKRLEDEAARKAEARAKAAPPKKEGGDGAAERSERPDAPPTEKHVTAAASKMPAEAGT
ncbi:MAG: 30S ribosomal protein S2 [Planctomycetota bacterium]